MRRLSLLMLFLASSKLTFAAIYTVKSAGDGTFSAIQTCADAAVAGDTCMVYAGTYRENVIVRSSGVDSSKLISFVAAEPGVYVTDGWYISGQRYILLQGFEISTSAAWRYGITLNNSDYVQIVNNNIHNTTWDCIHSTTSNNTIIRSNSVSYCGTPSSQGQIGIYLVGDNLLVEGNDVSHTGDATRMFGSNIVVRNNVFHDIYLADWSNSTNHNDIVQTYCETTGRVMKYSLIEGNTVRDMPDREAHFVIFQGGSTSLCSGEHIIVRYNTTRNIGSYFGLVGGSTPPDAFSNVYFYNNTSGTIVLRDSMTYSVSFTQGSTNGRFKNNILYNNTKISYGQGYYADSSSIGLEGDYNLAYNSAGYTAWGPAIRDEVHKILNVDPLFVSASDYTLRGGSVAIDGGGALTTVSAEDTGSGGTLLLRDAGYFQPGFAGTFGDWIAVGTVTQVVQVVGVDYAKNAVTLANGVSRKSGDSVWLVKASDGRVVLKGEKPDIGAGEYVVGNRPIEPGNLRIVR